MRAPSPRRPRSDARCEALVASLDALCETWLRPHIDRLSSGAIVPREKVFNDGLWKTIHLHSWEVALLDSNLLQRLREIRQLGVIHWVYPTANHSRFEHSIGVVHQMQALLDGIHRNSSPAGEPLIDDGMRYLLRLAALLHDCGHAIMSHVSEEIIKTLDGVAPLVDFTEKTYCSWKTPPPSEAIAAVFVRSPAFRELITHRAVGADFIRDPDEACETLASLIVGGPPRRMMEYTALLLNGAFDADKLDYMPRDCMMAGVPCGVDLDRLIEKIQVLDVPRAVLEDRAPGYAEWVSRYRGGELSDRVRVLAVGGSNAVVREYAEMRRVLFAKLYHHHKVRAIELMARRNFASLQQEKPRLEDWLRLTDHDLLVERNRDERKLPNHLRDRFLPKRSFAVRIDEADGDAIRLVREHQKQGLLRDEIKRLALEAASILGTRPEFSGAERAIGEIEIEIDIINTRRAELDGFPFSGDTEGDFTDFRRESGDLAEMSAGPGEKEPHPRNIAVSEVRIYAAERAVVPVFFASRFVFERDYRQEMQPQSYSALRFDSGQLQAYDDELAHGGFYGDSTRPKSHFTSARIVSHRDAQLEKFLNAAWPRIERLTLDFARYQEPTIDGEGHGVVSSVAIAAFLRQFETAELARPALRLLEEVDFIDRASFVKRLERELEKAAERMPIAFVCPLGSTGDSSAFASYIMNDVREELRVPVLPLEMALERCQRVQGVQIVLWDDLCGRGHHAINTLQQWLDHASGSRKTLAWPLTRTHAKRFKKMPVSICFAVALEGGLENLRSEVSALGFTSLEVITPDKCHPTNDTFLQSPELGTAAERDKLAQFLKEKADEVLRVAKKDDIRFTDEERERRLLGYGNGAQRLVFYYNVPKVTITCLSHGWPGIWNPLFRRRPKKSLPPPRVGPRARER